MLWLGLFLPRLPLEVFLRGVVHDTPSPPRESGPSARRRDFSSLSGRSPPDGPLLAVCEHHRISQASEGARTIGVQRGMKRATALALAPKLEIVERAPALELDALRQIACWALQFTPCVSLHPHDTANADARGLLLEIEPSLRLFGGLDALITRVRAGLAELGFSAQSACAPTATGAWLLAGHRDGLCAPTQARLDACLASLPVRQLDAARPHLATLESIGVRTLQDLALLPRAGLARRFGGGLLAELDRAFGRLPEPRTWFESPPVFDARLELLAQVENAQALLSGARRLLTQLCGWLSARQAAVRAFELSAEHDDLPPTPLAVRLSEASRDADRLIGLLRETLAVTRLPAPVHTLRLRCDQVVPSAASNEELFPVPSSAQEGLGRLIERLQARLGRGGVGRLLLACDHRPEAAYRVEPVERPPHGGAQPPSDDPRVGGALPRPLWLLDRPIPLTERNNRPWWHGPLTLLAGPERIESGWWDDALVQRDYFIASDESNTLLWIYRERIPRAESRRGWFIQGRFG